MHFFKQEIRNILKKVEKGKRRTTKDPQHLEKDPLVDVTVDASVEVAIALDISIALVATPTEKMQLEKSLKMTASPTR